MNEYLIPIVVGASCLVAGGFALRPLIGQIGDLFRPIVEARPLLNKSERMLHSALCVSLAELKRNDLYLFTQVSYGEFLRARDQGTFRSFNSKRADFLIADRAFNPVLVIEYQGGGHWGSNWISKQNTKRRDAIKRSVLRRAGLPLIEIYVGFTLENVRNLLGEAILPSGQPKHALNQAGKRRPTGRAQSPQTLH